MARQREFDETQVVDSALHLFWSKGFETTTLDDICEHASISKSSLYSAFSSKHELLDKVLHRYGETWMVGLMEPVSRPNAGRAEIEEATALLIDRYASPAGRQGCLVLNCAVDVAPNDRRIRETAKGVRGVFEDALFSAIKRGQADGTIVSKESPRSLARALLTMMNGMSILAKLHPSRAALEDIARMAMKLLD